MKSAGALRHLERTLEKGWKRFRKDFKRSRKEFSENAVHDSRVEARRLRAVLDLAGIWCPRRAVEKANKGLKGYVKTFSDLRDTQVQVRYVGRMMRQFFAARTFHAYLVKQERVREREALEKLRRVRTKRIGRALNRCAERLDKCRHGNRAGDAEAALLRALDKAFAVVLQMKKRIRKSSLASVHRTRVAFKRFRYMVEAQAELLPCATEEQLEAMRLYQAMMGDIQDLRVLLKALAAYCEEHEIEPRPAELLREELQRRLRWLTQRFLHSANQLKDFWPLTDSRRPVRLKATRRA